MDHFASHPAVRVRAVLSDRKAAGVHAKAAQRGVESFWLSPKLLKDAQGFADFVASFSPDLIVLAGYLRLIPEELIAGFAGRLINIHPSLLPAFGGPGMYGHHVHQAVAESKETYSGISIHEVNEHFDEGRVLFQASVRLEAGMSPESIAAAVLALEHRHYPLVLESLLHRWTDHSADPQV